MNEIPDTADTENNCLVVSNTVNNSYACMTLKTK